MSLPLLALLPLLSPQIIGQAPPVLGPFVGGLTPTSATVWVRLDRRDPIHMSLVDASGKALKDQTTNPSIEQDKCIRWELNGLDPDTAYAINVSGDRTFFRTPPDPDKPAKVVLALGSSADDRPGLPNPVWASIQKASPDALVLLGDTPYIESTDLEMQRRRYVEFFANKDLTALLQQTAFYATWNAHDFAKEGADGSTAGKENSRRAFVEHHVNPGAGDGGQGIYTSFRRGAVEVFLLDTRWYSGPAGSFVDPAKPTVLGEKQWDWLQSALIASKAAFKLVVSGRPWSEAPGVPKPETWEACAHERAALFAFLSQKSISGVVLVGGGSQRSRVVLHPPEETGLAYTVRELATGPLGTNPSKEAGAAGPTILWDKAEANSFLLATVDSTLQPAVLTASFRTAGAGEVNKIELPADGLRVHSAIYPAPREDDGAKKRTAEVMARAKKGPADLVFLGDSITEGWENDGKEVWEKSYGSRKAMELGVGGDRTQHVLWRIDHGQLDGLSPKLVVLMIGTNNSNAADNTSREIGDGIEAIVGRIRRKCPQSKVLLLAVFPRGEKPNSQRAKNDEASHFAAEAAADGKTVQFLDISSSFLGKDGVLPRDVMPDFLHPNAKGYAIWASAIEAKVKEMMGG